ncbi:MAG: peptide chain release factor 2 [Firmicutes bacterium]|nr:peptide chain release factor 2 [Bacillota bacterium]
MELYEITNYYQDYKKRILDYGGHFEARDVKNQIQQLESETSLPDFWSDRKRSQSIIDELNGLKKDYESVSKLKEEIDGNIELLDLVKENSDEEIQMMLEETISSIQSRLEELEISLLLNGKYDALGAILEIHSGAGGTEACDWANMLYRMYARWCEKHGYKMEQVASEDGDEAGIKSVTVLITGRNVYGYLKCEKGVHRLVRISPFDSNSRRHTSFASVDVTPLFDGMDTDIEIKESDLKIDVYRSSGAGGQHVNKTESAVRITHLPTGIVVTCQNERSQIQNRERAMEVLKNKLYQLELEKREAHLQSIKGDLMKIDFGSQIRSYVMHPYSLVKDHRTNTESTNVSNVLDGDIDLFINAFLKKEEA